MKKVTALILGGGQGKRLYPLTMHRSKPAVPVGGKYRLIDIPISNCLHSTIKNIFVLTQFNSESLNNHVNNTYRFDYFSRAFVRILAAEQTLDNTNWFQGTADAVRKNLSHLNLSGDDEVLILSGDHLYNMDYRDLVQFHRSAGADITISVISIKESEISEFGILKLDRGHKVSGFSEKPKKGVNLNNFRYKGKALPHQGPPPHSSYLASMGVYLFKASALEKVLGGSDADFGKEVIPHSIRRFKTFGYIFNGYWKDMGTIKSYYDANIDLAAYKPHFSFFYEGSVFTRPRFLPPARIARCNVEHSLVTEGCVIDDADIKNSIVGLRTVIGKGCKITRAVIMGSDYYEDPHTQERVKIGIGNRTVIDKAIIDKNARIGSGVVIKNLKGVENFDGEDYFIRDGIVIIPKNAKIPDGRRI